jgi:hypothetical protein
VPLAAAKPAAAGSASAMLDCQTIQRSKLELIARGGWVLALLGFAALTGDAATNQIQYLSGTDKDHTVPCEFRVSAGRNSGFWTNLSVTSCWDTKGFGSYEYGNDSTSEQGEYRCHFTVPVAWTNQRVFLVFEGAMTDT